MRILFLDQTGQLGGAELCLIDVAKFYQDRALVGLFADGPLRNSLEQHHIPVQVLSNQPIQVRKDSDIIEGFKSLNQLFPLIFQVVQKANDYDLIYANTQKALVVGALASVFSRRPLVYHLHDILSPDHFSQTNRRLAITLANRFASLVIANSQATREAFVEAGGRKELTAVVYNGFEPRQYQVPEVDINLLKKQLGLDGQFVVGHFSRLSPWKGQHILLEALGQCPSDVTAIFVGDCLFGEQDYAEHLRQQVRELKLEERVRFLGFQPDVVPLMHSCDLITHTSTTPEPFGRVIVEAMLCGRPVVGAASGGVLELIEDGKTGWLVAAGNSLQLAEVICAIKNQPEKAKTIADHSKIQASKNFRLDSINRQISQLLSQALSRAC
jgi:glycosyltransferase involved in cell wall biosynthesis